MAGVSSPVKLAFWVASVGAVVTACGGAHLPAEPELKPAALPLGLQPDGSVVLPPDDDLRIPALHFSAPLFPCPVKEGELAFLDLSIRAQPAAIASKHLLSLCPEAARSSPSDLGEALSRCAHEHFKSPEIWQSETLPDAGFCARTLGRGWQMPKASLLRKLSEQQLDQLLRPDGIELGTTLAPARIFALGESGYPVAATMRGVESNDDAPAWLRCVRDASTPAPGVLGPLKPDFVCAPVSVD